MDIHELNAMFEPASVAVFGASEREDSVGGIVFRNLLEGGYKGELIPVNPKHKQIHSVACLQGPKDLRHGVDLAVIATPAPTVVGILSALVDVGIKAVVVLSAGFAEAGEKGKAMQAEAAAIARRHHIRLLGPNCLGLLTPSIGLNASFAFGRVKAGDLALVSQSGAICTAILDWASPNQVGFSSVVSLGDAADVDFGDALDYLALDHKTKSILLYVEGVNDARRFMSGLRAAARIKPVIVVKAGRSKESTRAAISTPAPWSPETTSSTPHCSAPARFVPTPSAGCLLLRQCCLRVCAPLANTWPLSPTVVGRALSPRTGPLNVVCNWPA